MGTRGCFQQDETMKKGQNHRQHDEKQCQKIDITMKAKPGLQTKQGKPSQNHRQNKTKQATAIAKTMKTGPKKETKGKRQEEEEKTKEER